MFEEKNTTENAPNSAKIGKLYPVSFLIRYSFLRACNSNIFFLAGFLFNEV
jgi:hypothetical protein